MPWDYKVILGYSFIIYSGIKDSPCAIAIMKTKLACWAEIDDLIVLRSVSTIDLFFYYGGSRDNFSSEYH
jgi:amino acid permease